MEDVWHQFWSLHRTCQALLLLTWAPSHVGQAQLDAGDISCLDGCLNHAADRLAGKASASHELAAWYPRHVAEVDKLVKDVQSRMIAVNLKHTQEHGMPPRVPKAPRGRK